MVLVLIFGCMFSGKSSELIRYIDEYTLCINSSMDTRVGMSIGTHDNVVVESVKAKRLGEVIVSGGVRKILVDEGQFFEDLYENVMKWIEEGYEVYVAGLNGGVMSEVIGEMYRLIPHCTGIIYKTAKCEKCGITAQYGKFREKVKIEELRAEDYIGGKEKYIALCTKCVKTT